MADKGQHKSGPKNDKLKNDYRRPQIHEGQGSTSVINCK